LARYRNISDDPIVALLNGDQEDDWFEDGYCCRRLRKEKP
jgi:hypothetical protein